MYKVRCMCCGEYERERFYLKIKANYIKMEGN